jgi:hypothetical protein
MGNKLLKILKLRKQLKYLDNLDDILCDNDDGGLYSDFNDNEEKTFNNFIDFLIDIKIKIEQEIKKEETQYIKNNI